MKNWTITVNEVPYTIKVKGGKIWINETKYALRKQPHRTKLLLFSEYDLPIPGVQAMLTTGSTSWNLIVNGVNVVTGESYEIMNKLPVWVYPFIVLHLINFMNGALGGVLAVLGSFATIKIAANLKQHVGVKILLSTLVLIGCWVGIFIIAFMLAVLLG